jgi:hypothetical protein
MEQVFSRAGQLSEVNLDPDSFTDMVSIMVNKLEYKPSVKDIMDKYYEMFRVKNSVNKKDFFNSPDSPSQVLQAAGQLCHNIESPQCCTWSPRSSVYRDVCAPSVDIPRLPEPTPLTMHRVVSQVPPPLCSSM